MILDALDHDYEKVIENEYKEGKFDKILRIVPSNLKQVFKISFTAGIVYFIFGFIEITYYSRPFLDLSSDTNWSDLRMQNIENSSNISTYIFIKIISAILFTLLM